MTGLYWRVVEHWGGFRQGFAEVQWSWFNKATLFSDPFPLDEESVLLRILNIGDSLFDVNVVIAYFLFELGKDRLWIKFIVFNWFLRCICLVFIGNSSLQKNPRKLFSRCQSRWRIAYGVECDLSHHRCWGNLVETSRSLLWDVLEGRQLLLIFCLFAFESIMLVEDLLRTLLELSIFIGRLQRVQFAISFESDCLVGVLFLLNRFPLLKPLLRC